MASIAWIFLWIFGILAIFFGAIFFGMCVTKLLAYLGLKEDGIVSSYLGFMSMVVAGLVIFTIVSYFSGKLNDSVITDYNESVAADAIATAKAKDNPKKRRNCDEYGDCEFLEPDSYQFEENVWGE